VYGHIFFVIRRSNKVFVRPAGTDEPGAGGAGLEQVS